MARNAGIRTLEGTVKNTSLLLILAMLPAAFVWNQFQSGVNPTIYIGIGGIGGFIVALVTVFKKEWSAITAPMYAGLEGLALGGISAIFEQKFPGIAIQAIGLTFMVLFGLLMAYKSGIIRATENFKLGVFAATSAIALFYLVSMILGFFQINIPLIHESGTVGILFSAVVVVVAALNLVMDFDFIEEGARAGAPKYMEWYGAFGLLVTLVWLYLEILRLLSKLRSRD
jgi:uncharacterized YccA/Bax inhibitor family protein